MNRFLKLTPKTLLFLIILTNQSFAQDFKKDTCQLNGPVKMVTYLQIIPAEDNYDERYDEVLMYTKTGFLYSKIHSSKMYGDTNKYLRNFSKDEKTCLVEFEFDKGDTSRRHIFTYYDSGNSIKEDLIIGQEHWSSFHYEYDTNGRIIRTYSYLISQEEQISEITYEYSTASQIIKIANLRKNVTNIKTFAYDRRGFLIKETMVDSNWARRSVIHKDSNGEITSREDFDQSKSPYTADSYIRTFTYNNKGQVARETQTNIDNELIVEIDFFYNKQGDVERQEYYNAEYDLTFTNRITHKYDVFDNCIERKLYFEGELNEIETFEITYYSVP
ncbi:MAG: hypothetical protein ACI8ZM_003018 [Crocinitomix sp.]|jgi:hypothetical protein